MSHVFTRYNACSMDVWPDAEGEYVDAQAAYDKVASLSDEIKTLKTQLKDTQKVLNQYQPVGSYFDGRILYERYAIA